jgi:hypothetical protein
MLHKFAVDLFFWSRSGLTEFLAYSAVLFTIAENIAVMIYLVLAPLKLLLMVTSAPKRGG